MHAKVKKVIMQLQMSLSCKSILLVLEQERFLQVPQPEKESPGGCSPP